MQDICYTQNDRDSLLRTFAVEKLTEANGIRKLRSFEDSDTSLLCMSGNRESTLVLYSLIIRKTVSASSRMFNHKGSVCLKTQLPRHSFSLPWFSRTPPLATAVGNLSLM